MALTPKPKYYVYHLIDPRNGTVFYVGKGCGARIKHHERDASKFRFLNSEKEEVIHQIWDAGLTVGHVIKQRFDSEAHAYIFEKDEIERIGLENLTNLAKGGEPEAQKALKRGERFIVAMRNLIPSLGASGKDVATKLIAEMEENLDVCRRVLKTI